jgi:hypothetical protein
MGSGARPRFCFPSVPIPLSDHLSMMTRTIAALILLLPFLSACDMAESSDDVNQDRIHTLYELHHDGSNGITYARAHFRFGGPTGTQLMLAGRSDVTFDGQLLTLQVVPVVNLTYYERSFTGERNAGTFRFTDTEGRSYTNNAQMRPIGLPQELGPISMSASHELEFTGAPLAPGEEAAVLLLRTDDEFELARFTRREVGSRSVILTRQELQRIGVGPVRVVIERRTDAVLAEGTSAGGSIIGRYEAPRRTAEITL